MPPIALLAASLTVGFERASDANGPDPAARAYSHQGTGLPKAPRADPADTARCIQREDYGKEVGANLESLLRSPVYVAWKGKRVVVALAPLVSDAADELGSLPEGFRWNSERKLFWQATMVRVDPPPRTKYEFESEEETLDDDGFDMRYLARSRKAGASYLLRGKILKLPPAGAGGVSYELWMQLVEVSSARVVWQKRTQFARPPPQRARVLGIGVDEERVTITCDNNLGTPKCTFFTKIHTLDLGTACEVVAWYAPKLAARRGSMTFDGDQVSALADIPGCAGLPSERPVVESGTPHEVNVTLHPATLASTLRWWRPTHNTVPEGGLFPRPLPAATARHLLSNYRPAELEARVYPIEEIATPTFADPRDHCVDTYVSVAHPFKVAGLSSEGKTPWGWQTQRDQMHMREIQGQTVWTGVLRSTPISHWALRVKEDGPAAQKRSPHEREIGGGLLLALGSTMAGRQGDATVRGRFGGEFAMPNWALYALTLDTDFQRRHILTPLVEVATPAWLLLPSIGLGVGAPMEVAPGFRAGVRVQFDAHFGPVGFVTSVDMYPDTDPTPHGAGFTEVSLLGQIGI